MRVGVGWMDRLGRMWNINDEEDYNKGKLLVWYLVFLQSYNWMEYIMCMTHVNLNHIFLFFLITLK